MKSRRTDHDIDSEDFLLSDEPDFSEASDNDEDFNEDQQQGPRFNMSIRHRIEEKLEERRLQRELDEYEFSESGLGDDGILH